MGALSVLCWQCHRPSFSWKQSGDPVPHKALVNIHFTLYFGYCINWHGHLKSQFVKRSTFSRQNPAGFVMGKRQTSTGKSVWRPKNTKKHKQDPRSIYYCTPFVKTAAIPYHTIHTNLILSRLWMIYVYIQSFWELDLGSPTAGCKQGASALSANL